jgi:FdrA protein
LGDTIINIVKKDFYRDSLQLMRITDDARRVVDGALDVAVVMGTSTNKEMLKGIGLLDPTGEKATPSDVIIAIKLEDRADPARAVSIVEGLLQERAQTGKEGSDQSTFETIEEALAALPEANLGLVSVPGRYAKDVCMILLKRGVSVQVFSDHVTLQDELELKRFASTRGLFVLGPGSGTSIISGKGIAFANNVKRGGLGVVAAAGTGLQELSVLVDRLGLGISHALGVGGGDVKSEVGGIMSKLCLERLESDGGTTALCFISKPPSKEVADELVDFIKAKIKKSIVICFIGADLGSKEEERIKFAETLHTAAIRVSDMMGGSGSLGTPIEKLKEVWVSCSYRLGEEQRFLRGLFTGGTLTYESLVITTELLGEVWSNSPIDPRMALEDYRVSRGNTLLDMGEEEFTEGRPHPMIDPTLRKMRLIQEASDPKVGVIMLDFVLGYGSHPDPAGEMVDPIVKANQLAAAEGRQLLIFGHVCGTEQDPQTLSRQETKLKEAGVFLFPTNAEMALSAAMVLKYKQEGVGCMDDHVSNSLRRFLGVS